jgi:dipeptidyl aminopeptidase/acylaminoacyl peptidase
LDRASTPTLVHVGAQDERAPAAHARTLYRALRHHLGVPTELIVYPGEEHGLSTYSHHKAKMEWDHAWSDRYVLGRPRGGAERIGAAGFGS